MPESPTVSIIDPDAAARSTVASTAAEMGVVSKQFVNAEAFFEAEIADQPGCVVSEFRLLGINGIRFQERLLRDHHVLPVIFVTAHPETDLIVRAMRNDAVTVLEKPASVQALWDSIRLGISRDTALRELRAKRDEWRQRLIRLTKKERQVLDLLVQGKANKSIARALEVSIRTVESRRQQLFKKTGTESVAELVSLIVERGIPQDD